MKWIDWVATGIVIGLLVFSILGIIGCAQLHDPSGIKAGSTGDIAVTSHGWIGAIISLLGGMVIMAIMTVRIVKWVTRNANVPR